MPDAEKVSCTNEPDSRCILRRRATPAWLLIGEPSDSITQNDHFSLVWYGEFNAQCIAVV